MSRSLTLLAAVAVALALGVGMAVVSYAGFKGARGIRQLDTTALRLLSKNQIAFGIMLFAYGAYCFLSAMHEIAPLASVSDPETAELLADYEPLIRQMMMVLYAGVMACAIIGPGLMVWYYRSREKVLVRYLQETPAWILDLQRAGTLRW